MRKLLLIVLDLCRLRRGPQDLPYAPTLLALLVVLGIGLDLGVGALSGEGGMAAGAVPRVLVGTAFSLLLLYGLLRVRHFHNRFVQTALALLLTGIVFTLVLMPILLLSGPPPASATGMSPLQVLTGWAMLGLVVWKLAVDAHILRHALELPFPAAFLLAFLWAVADYLVGRSLSGGGGT